MDKILLLGCLTLITIASIKCSIVRTDTILDDDQSDFYRIETARDIIINIDGSVHFNTFYLNTNNRKYVQNFSFCL